MKFLYGADWHIRYSNPKCRTDNYSETVIKKLLWLDSMQQTFKCPIINGGDIMDKDLYKSPSDIVLTLKIVEKYLPDMIGIIGNHDLLHRSIAYLDRSTIAVPIASGKMEHIQGYYNLDSKTRLFGFDYGTGGIKHPDPEDLIDGCNIAIVHEYVSKKPNSLFGKLVGKELLEEFPEFNIILCGDNHTTFMEEVDGRLLINPGSFLRMDADQMDFKPSIFLIDTDKLSYEQIFVPIEEGVISREHLDIQKDRDERIDSFVVSLDQEYEISDSFVKNMEKYLLENKYDGEDLLINKNVEKFINKALEGNIE